MQCKRVLGSILSLILIVGCGSEPTGPDPTDEVDSEESPSLVGWWELVQDDGDVTYLGFGTDGWCSWIDVTTYGQNDCIYLEFTATADRVTLGLPDGSELITFVFGFDEQGRLWLQPESVPERVHFNSVPANVVPTHICG